MTNTVFIVEENRAIASRMSSVLNHCESEFQTLTCSGPYGAVQLAQTIKPNLVLMDASTDTRGAVLCGLALREFYSVNVVLMTTSATLDSILLHSLSQSGRPFPVLHKSMDPMQLVEEVRRHAVACAPKTIAPRFTKDTFCRGIQRPTRTRAVQARLHG